MDVWITFSFVQAVLDFQIFNFRTTRTFILYKFSSLIHLLYTIYGLSYTTDEWTFRAVAQWCCKTESRTMFCVYTKCQKGWSQWLHCLMHGSAAVRLLVWRVRIPPETCMSVLWMLCLVRSRSLRRADCLSVGVLPSVVCLRWGLHETTSHATHWLVLFASEFKSTCELAGD